MRSARGWWWWGRLVGACWSALVFALLLSVFLPWSLLLFVLAGWLAPAATEGQYKCGTLLLLNLRRGLPLAERAGSTSRGWPCTAKVAFDFKLSTRRNAPCSAVHGFERRWACCGTPQLLHLGMIACPWLPCAEVIRKNPMGCM